MFPETFMAFERESTTVANTPTMPGIKNSWSLLAFARSHGQMKVVPCHRTNPDTGEVENFKSCAFVDPNDNTSVTFVSFSSRLGELTPSEIAARKNDLQVAELNSGNFSLCERGAGAWEDVNLDL